MLNAKLLLMHGINLNVLGKRDVNHYGHVTLQQLEMITQEAAAKHGFEVMCYQSNHEGELVEVLQSQANQCAGIIINPGAFTHYSYGLHDALLDTQLPIVEVHLSKLAEREAWRTQSVIAPLCLRVIQGQREEGYKQAVTTIVEHLRAHT